MPARSPAAVTRRTVVLGAGVAVGSAAVAACVTVDTSRTDAPQSGAGTVLGPASDVPIGGARIYADHGVVVAQPTSGSFTSFSTRCPHQGCAVASAEGSSIVCPCHGSSFALDGSVTQGPAQSGLQSVPVTVENGEIKLA